MKKISKTVKTSVIGAFIGGAFVIAAVFLTQYLSSLHQDRPSVDVAASGKVEVDYSDRGAFFKNLVGLVPLPLKGSHSIRVWRMDLLGDGQNHEFFFLTDLVDKYYYYGVATDRNGSMELLYYEKDFLGSTTDCVPFMAGKAKYLLLYTIGGSGAFMYPTVLSYDGIRKLRTVWVGPGLGGGFYYFRSGKLLIVGNNVRYYLNYENGNFRLQRNRDRYVRESSTVHVLRIDTQATRLSFEYDEKPLPYEYRGEDAYFTLPLSISKTDLLVIDDNFSAENRYVRILTSEGDGIDFSPGYFWTASFSKTGQKEMSFSDSYSAWYHLNIDVK